jgi:xanthine dehydrogenase YagT iron-sulfur-binding subunit
LKLSRRAFLKSAGVGAAAATFVDATSSEQAPTILGPGAVPLSLRVNGETRTVRVEPRVTLLRALRNSLDLTGAKEACDRGACGACTVLLDGAPILACMLLATDAVGHDLTTVEGLGTPGKMSRVQESFVACDALQCGFCTPGFVVASHALLSREAHPTQALIKEGLSGNLCRCGTYGRIFEAVQRAAAKGPSSRSTG